VLLALRRLQRLAVDRAAARGEDESFHARSVRRLEQANRRHDLVALPIEDPREQALPDLGIIAIEDAESGEMIEIDSGNPAVRENFSKLAQVRAEQLQKIFNREAIDSLRVSTDRPYVADLMAFFKNRVRKRS